MVADICYFTCEICGTEVNTNDFFTLVHVVKDIICMILFFSKMCFWLIYKSLTSGKLRNFPCICGHKAFWHLIPLKNITLPVGKIHWFYLFFKYKFERDEKLPLADCIRCMFKINKSIIPPCLEFEPLNNLIYLETLYKNKK